MAIPIFCLFFSTTKAKVSIETIIKIFYLFTIFFLLNINISFKEQLISIIVVLMPVIVEYLKKHHNWFAKIVGIIFLITIMILLKSNVLILSFIISFIFLLWPKNKKIVSLFGS